MQTPNAIKVCDETGGYLQCKICPIYSTCRKQYPSTEEFEKAIEEAAIKYLKGKQNFNIYS